MAAERRLRAAATAVVVVAVLLAWGFAAAGLAGDPRNSIHQPEGRGLKRLADGLRSEGFAVATLGAGPHALDAFEPARTVLVVAGVERAYSPGEIAAIVGFVERGGLALVADDFGLGDEVAEPFGVNFDRRVLRDAAFDRNVSLVRVNATAAGQNFSLVLNVPSSLGFAPDVRREVLAESSTDSFLDHDGDGIEGPADVKGPFPVLALVPRGEGRALFASDPGFLADGLADTNGPFLRALFRGLLPEGGTVAFDESRHPVGMPGAVLGGLLAGEVQLASEPALALAAGPGLALLGYAAWRGFRRPAPLGSHAPRLAEPLLQGSPEQREARLRGLAARAVLDARGLPPDAPEAGQPERLAALAGDPVLAALLRGQGVRAAPEDLVARIEALGKARRGRP